MKLDINILKAATIAAAGKKSVKQLFKCLHLTKDGYLQSTDGFMTFEYKFNNLTLDQDYSFIPNNEILEILSSDDFKIEKLTNETIRISNCQKSLLAHDEIGAFPNFAFFDKKFKNGSINNLILTDIVLEKIHKIAKQLDCNISLMFGESQFKPIKVNCFKYGFLINDLTLYVAPGLRNYK